MAISKVKLSNNTTQDIHDIRISGIDTTPTSGSSNVITSGGVYNYIASRGENLLTNGTALLGNNYNFSGLTFDGSDTYYAAGCFKKNNWASYASFVNDEFIAVDVNQVYLFDFYTKTDTDGAEVNGCFNAYDIDFNKIGSYQVAPKANTLTYLTQELHVGDTVIHVNDLTGWSTGNYAVENAILFWGYKNSYGYEYPAETYTRYYYSGLWSSSSQLDFTNNTITLTSAWAGPEFTVNTKLSQGQNGSGALYAYIDGGSISASLHHVGEWEHHYYTISGLQNKNSFAVSQFPFGTAFVKVGLMNRPSSNGQNFKISTLSFSSQASNKEAKNHLKLSGGTMTGDILPNATGTLNLGSSSKRWKILGTTGNFSSSVTASSFVKSNGTSSQFLKADGSVDSNVYLSASSEQLTARLTSAEITALLDL